MEAGRRKNREREIGKKKEGETANLKEKYGNTAEEKMFKGIFFFADNIYIIHKSIFPVTTLHKIERL